MKSDLSAKGDRVTNRYLFFPANPPSLLVFLALVFGTVALIPRSEARVSSGSFVLAQVDDAALSKDALFGDSSDDLPLAKAPVLEKRSAVRGSVQAELARTYATPSHWSKMRLRSDLSANGTLSDTLKYRLGVRIGVDAAYSGEKDFYPADVRRDRRFEAELRENYLDINAGSLDFRVGRQHVVWGEMVGLYFADVVSARDLTEFILPDFEAQRIPQWAARAEYFAGDLHAELLWVPLPSYDRLGKPGGDFYPAQPAPVGASVVFRDGETPSRKLSNTNYGLRLSGLMNGWDLSAFYYQSMDVAPTFKREIVAPATFIFEPEHLRISQGGGTLSKDFGAVVLKSEVVYTTGREFAVLRLADHDGVVPSDTIDWALGFELTPSDSVRFNVQLFQRAFRDHDPDMLTKPRETGYSVYLTKKFADTFEAQLLWISSFDREDWLMRPKLSWSFEKNWRALFGADIFKGPALGFFGQYDNQDRVYTELRYSF